MRYFLIVFVLLVGCAGSISALDIEDRVWIELGECMDVENFHLLEQPYIVISDLPCGNPSFLACARSAENTVYVRPTYRNDEVYEGVLRHEYTHIILYQTTGHADGSHETIWFIERPCWKRY